MVRGFDTGTNRGDARVLCCSGQDVPPCRVTNVALYVYVLLYVGLTKNPTSPVISCLASRLVVWGQQGDLINSFEFFLTEGWGLERGHIFFNLSHFGGSDKDAGDL